MFYSPGALHSTWWCIILCLSTTFGCSARVCICTWFWLWYVLVGAAPAPRLGPAFSFAFPFSIHSHANRCNCCTSLHSLRATAVNSWWDLQPPQFMWKHLSSIFLFLFFYDLQLFRYRHQIEIANVKCHRENVLYALSSGSYMKYCSNFVFY